MKNDELVSYYQKYYKTFLLFALSYTHDIARAEDLVSNAYLKAIVSYRDGYFKAWMYKVIRNEFYSSARLDKRVLLQEDEVLNNYKDEENLVENFIIGEKKQWLYQRILKLPNRQKQIMLLSAFHDVSDDEIANILNLSVENVRVIKYRTRKKLMSEYEEAWT